MGSCELSFKEADREFKDWVENCVPADEQQNAMDAYMTALDAFLRELNLKGLELIQWSYSEDDEDKKVVE